MTEHEFDDLTLNKEVAEMEEDEAKKTLAEFMEAHQTNQTAYDELKGELEETETEFQEKLDEKEEVIAEFKQERAEEAAEYVNIPADLVATRFSFEEIDQIIEEGSEYSEETSEESEEEEDETITTFSDKPEKGQTEGGGTSKYNDRAREKLSQHGLTMGDN